MNYISTKLRFKKKKINIKELDKVYPDGECPEIDS